jgi:hypothetical protein
MGSLAIAGLRSILGAGNMITTVITLRALGMTMFRMPIFTWNILVTSLMTLLAFPLLIDASAVGRPTIARVRPMPPSNTITRTCSTVSKPKYTREDGGVRPLGCLSAARRPGRMTGDTGPGR